MSTPQSIINICSGVRLDSRYDHTIYFDSVSDQQEFFAGKVVKTFSAYSYLRKSWSIKVEATMEQARTWNYLYFRNTSSGKYYYYFINQIEYVNDSTVEISLELDVMQTYHFDYELLECFVERQHAESDEIGEHTVEEGLDVGEMYTPGRGEFSVGDLCIMILSTINPNAQTEEQAVPALPYIYNGVFSGVKLWAVHNSRWNDWGNQLEKLMEIGQESAIMAMWMYPQKLVRIAGEGGWSQSDLALPVEEAYDYKYGDQFDFAPMLTTFDGYNPKNNKLHTYPYHFFTVNNNQGNVGVFRYERFVNPQDEVKFCMSGSVSPDGGVRITPINYNGQYYNFTESLTITGFPSCAWNSDIFKLWLAQNQNSQHMNMISGGAKILAGVAGGVASLILPDAGVLGGVGVGTAISGFNQISDALTQKKDKDIIPPQAKGNFSVSVNITDKRYFTFEEKMLTAERARIIDDYFTMFGYKVNRVKVPNIHARENWTYVKTVGCKIAGNMCTEDIVKIESIFDKGITFWTSPEFVGEYWLANDTLEN